MFFEVYALKRRILMNQKDSFYTKMLNNISEKALQLMTTINDMTDEITSKFIASPLTYDINCFEETIQDCTQRYTLFENFYNLFDRKAKIDLSHAEKLIELSSTVNKLDNAENCSKPSQILYNKFIKIIETEGLNLKKLNADVEQQALKQIREQISLAQKDMKKYITLGKSLKKDLEYDSDGLQKIKSKFYKKNTQLEKMKLDYITSTILSDRDFEKKNKLFLKIKEVESETAPLRKSYETLSSKYSESVSTFAWRLGEILSKLENRQLLILETMKQSLINYQLFNSASGASIVHDTQKFLSFFNILAVQQTQIKRHTEQQLEQQRRLLESNYCNPAEYIEHLFEKIENATIQEVIRYGSNHQYKTELSEYFENSFESSDSGDCSVYGKFEEISDYTLRIIEIFKAVFEYENYESPQSHFSESTLMEFKELIMGRPNLRKDFIMCLQKYRLKGRFEIHEKNQKRIVSMIEIFLDICDRQFDTYNSKQLMVLSFTYYFVSPTEDSSTKVDLQHFIKNHAIWSNIKWWECGLLQSVYEEYKVKANSKQSPQLKKKSEMNKKTSCQVVIQNGSKKQICQEQCPVMTMVSIWDIKGTSLKKLESEQEDILMNICFNQMAYYVHNMQLFDIEAHLISSYAHKYIKLLGLNAKMATNILLMCGSKESIQ